MTQVLAAVIALAKFNLVYQQPKKKTSFQSEIWPLSKSAPTGYDPFCCWTSRFPVDPIPASEVHALAKK